MEDKCSIAFYQELNDTSPNLFTYNRDFKVFRRVSQRCGIKINLHLIRSIFVERCREAGIDKGCIDALQGRVPRTILDKHYSDYSPHKLEKLYRGRALSHFIPLIFMPLGKSLTPYPMPKK